MNLFVKTVLFGSFLSWCLFCCTASGQIQQGKSLKKIQTCQHWKFSPTDDPHFAKVDILLRNDEKVTMKLSVALKCNTTKKLREPPSSYQVKPGRTKKAIFAIAVDYQHFHFDSSVRHQECLLATWTNDGRLFNCRFNISIWPNGLFHYKCIPFQKGQFGVQLVSASKTTQIKLKNTGSRSFYIVNSTCEPRVPTLQHTHLYKRLNPDQTWALEFPQKCSGVTNMNYRGNCSVMVYHVCGTATTFLWQTQFPYQDGEVEECDHIKSSISVYEPGILSELFGTSDVLATIFLVFIVIEIVVISVTIVVKIILQRAESLM